MPKKDCENCGCVVYDGYCTHCDELVFIDEQDYWNDANKDYY